MISRTATRAAALTAIAAVLLAPGVADAKKRVPPPTGPDQCTAIQGYANYNDPTGSGLSAPIMNWSTETFGIKDSVTGGTIPLCSGYTYTIKMASTDGSSLGWQPDNSKPWSPSNVAVGNNVSNVTFTVTPTDNATELSAYGTTNGYLGTSASCAGHSAVQMSVTTTSPTGVTTYWPDTNGDPASSKDLCASPPIGGYYYG